MIVQPLTSGQISFPHPIYHPPLVCDFSFLEIFVKVLHLSLLKPRIDFDRRGAGDRTSP